MSAHPFLFPFGDTERWLSYLENCLNWNKDQLQQAELLLQKNLIPIASGPELGHYLGISTQLVVKMSAFPEKFYRSFKILKKNGKYRDITAPRIFLKTVQRYILDCILSPLDVHPCAIGFKRGCSMQNGAAQHVGNKYLWNIDLKDFFPSISWVHITNLFSKIGYNTQATIFLSGLCSLNGKLPQGAPTSPAISNLVFNDLDTIIFDISKKFSVIYTRYADDLSFSSNNLISKDFQTQIRDLLSSNHFQINENKCRLLGPKCRREITGLTVNVQVSVPRTTRRNLRARFHKVALNPTNFMEEKQILLGYAHWISQHHPKQGDQFFAVASKIPPKKPL